MEKSWVESKNYLVASNLTGYAKTSQIPTKVSNLTNDSGYVTASIVNGYATQNWVNGKNYITGITKADVEKVLIGNITSHTHNYLSSITKAQVEAVLTGNISSHVHNQYYGSTVSRAANTVLAGPNGTAGAGTFRKLVSADIPALAISKITNLQSTLNGKSSVAHTHTFASLTSKPTTLEGYGITDALGINSNAVSASKLSTARAISLTGSVTGSVSFDGSKNVSIATKTAHTHTFASLTSKPTTLAGYGITDALGKLETAVSATKLLNSRTIWGQSFNGTSNVSGNMTGVDNITMIGDLNIKNKTIKYDTSLGAFVLDGHLIVTGGITMYKK